MARIVPGDDADAASLLSASLSADNIAIAPCDTIYGILGRAPTTKERIYAIKGRGESKPLIVLHPTIASVLSLAIDTLPEPLLALWPGALTLVMRTLDGVAGYRVPADGFLIEVLNQTGPLYSTSVNMSGEAALWRIEDIKRTFGDKVDLIIDGGDLPGKMPSTIVDVSKKPYTVLRSGAIELPEEVRMLCR